MTIGSDDGLLAKLTAITWQAGDRIMDVYAGEIVAVTKSDGSPLTAADEAANDLICDQLALLSEDIPILSEEGGRDFTPPEGGPYWAVDPLDGTKEFIARNADFTVNIALIELGRPVLGVVFAPALGKTYAADGQGAWRKTGDGPWQAISVERFETDQPCRIVVSRRHGLADLEAMLGDIPNHELIPMGSSLKFCAVADGSAHLYPRLGPTNIWDTAAAHAVVSQAGGFVLGIDGDELRYSDPAHTLNPPFVVSGDKKLALDLISSFGSRSDR